MKTTWLLGVTALALVACSSEETPTVLEVETPPPPSAEEQAPQIITLADIVDGEWRADAEKARDQFRHPIETLEFFGIEASDTVVEIWPGGGWYTNILAPWLASGDGKLIAAHWDPSSFEDADRRASIEQRIADFAAVYAADPDQFGTVEIASFGASSDVFAEPGSADAVLTFRNVHNWMSGDFTAKAFEDAYSALKPGGVLGVVEHRLPSSAEQPPRGTSGYVHEDFVKAMAAAAGFEFVAASEINANPADTADHPFGVWTLPPISATTNRDGTEVEGFDPEKYLAIGESDRMTLKFVKPTADPALEPVE
ncbi:MAG: class I SAM-dependent methyltransferase [Henriciella sp.]